MTEEAAIKTINAILNHIKNAQTDADFIEALEFAKVSIKSQCETHSQRQDALTYQLKDLVRLANVHGMYDAADWLKNAITKEEVNQ